MADNTPTASAPARAPDLAPVTPRAAPGRRGLLDGLAALLAGARRVLARARCGTGIAAGAE